MKRNMLRLWAKALGEKASHNRKEADTVAIIRTFIFLSYLTTNIFIVMGVIRHWDDNPKWNTDMNPGPCPRYR